MKYKISLLFSCLLLLKACDSNSVKDSRVSNNESDEITAQSEYLVTSDAFAVIVPNQSHFIDLQPHISDPNATLGDITLIDDVSVSSEACHDVQLNQSDLGITIDAKENMHCIYRFSAMNGVLSSTGTLQVLATASTNPYLAPLSKNIAYSDGTTRLEIVLSNEQSLDWSVDYELANVIIHGEEEVLGSANIKAGTRDTIEFNLPNSQLPGWNRVYYTVRDRTSPSDIRVGEITITMSDVLNIPPTIRAPLYEYHVEATEFDLDFQSRGCTIGVNDTSQSCGSFSEFNKFEFHSARYSTNYNNFVFHIELPPKVEFHGKKATVRIPGSSLTNWRVNVYNSENNTYSSNNRISSLPTRTFERTFTFTNVYGVWHLHNIIPIQADTSVTLDLSQLRGLDISDPDGHNWQISHISSVTAVVSIADPDNPTNKSFTFEGGIGVHYVNYVVNDHFGGFNSGILKFVIE